MKVEPKTLADAEAEDYKEICPDVDKSYNFNEIYIAILIGIIGAAAITILVILFL